MIYKMFKINLNFGQNTYTSFNFSQITGSNGYDHLSASYGSSTEQWIYRSLVQILRIKNKDIFLFYVFMKLKINGYPTARHFHPKECVFNKEFAQFWRS